MAFSRDVQGSLVNITLSWMFTTVLLFVVSIKSFENRVATEVVAVADSVVSVDTILGAINSTSNAEEAARSLSLPSAYSRAVIKQDLKRLRKDKEIAKRHNTVVLLKAIGVSVGLVVATIGLTSFQVSRGETDKKTVALLFLASVSLLTTEVVLYLTVLDRYDYGTSEQLYKFIAQDVFLPHNRGLPDKGRGCL